MSKINVPNILTIIRMILVIPFIACMALAIKYTNNKNIAIDYSNISHASNPSLLFLIAGIIFIVAMITDFVDGYIARKYNQVSTFGKIFDPIADKVMTSSCLIMMSIMQIIPFWIVIIFMARDITVDGLRNLAASKNIDVSASIWGKLKTLVQSFAIALIFIVYPLHNFGFLNSLWGFNNWQLLALYSPLLIALFLSLFSGYKYLWDLRKFIKLS